MYSGFQDFISHNLFSQVGQILFEKISLTIIIFFLFNQKRFFFPDALYLVFVGEVFLEVLVILPVFFYCL